MQTTTVLPDDYTARRPALHDADTIFALLSAYTTALLGFSDCTVGQVADELADPGFDRDNDGWLVLDATGRAAGYGTAYSRDQGRMIAVEIASCDSAVAPWLFEQAMQRALEMGRDGGHPEIIVDVYCYQADDLLRTLLPAHQFVLGTTYHRMRIDHTGPLVAPQPPDGVVVRRGAFDDAARWTAHELILGCFTGQYGFVGRPHDDWLEARES